MSIRLLIDNKCYTREVLTLIILYYAFVCLALFAFLVWGVGYLWESHRMSTLPDRVIYHSSNLKEQGPVLKRIVESFIEGRGENTADYTLVEPGAGLGRVSQFLLRSFAWKAAYAIEVGPFILGLAKLRSWVLPSRLVFVKQDFFQYKFPPKSLVYCYLFPALITKLYRQGSLKGQLVVSLSFAIEGLPPTQVLPLASWQKCLYVYDLRTSGGGAKA